MMKKPFQDNAWWFVLLVITYRGIYQVLGSYITAALAPNKPLFHAMIGGSIGFVLSIVGAIVMREEGPAWYAISLIIIALPTAWLGATLRIASLKKQ